MFFIPVFVKDDIKINYISEGKGEPLVLVHGFGTKLQGWQFQIDYFKNRMRVISLDNRGVGKSSRPDYPYSMNMFVEDLHGLLKYLKIKEKIHLCGISMGGMIVQDFALKYPQKLKSLILCATSEKLGKGIYKLIDGLKEMDLLTLEEKASSLFPYIYSRKFQRKLKEDPKLFNSIKDDIIFITPFRDPTTLKDYENQASAVEKHNTSNLLHKIKTSTLILGANRDRLIPMHHQKSLFEKILNSTFEILKGNGHGFTIEDPSKVNILIGKFINSIN